MPYDPHNVFAKILRREIPCNAVHEDEYALTFHDIAPAAPLHLVIIPKGAFLNFLDFHASATPELIRGFWAAVTHVANAHTNGHFRLITNNGTQGGQTVPHFHVHILAGTQMGGLV